MGVIKYYTSFADKIYIFYDDWVVWWVSIKKVQHCWHNNLLPPVNRAILTSHDASCKYLSMALPYKKCSITMAPSLDVKLPQWYFNFGIPWKRGPKWFPLLMSAKMTLHSWNIIKYTKRKSIRSTIKKYLLTIQFNDTYSQQKHK